MKVEVIMSCMNQTDGSIISDSNLNDENVLVVNQVRDAEEKLLEFNSKHRMINTPTRGLSVSRNIAVDNTKGDICVLADDDEVFENNLSEIVTDAYSKLPDADIIAFSVKNLNCKLKSTMHRLKGFEIYRVASVQISFKTRSVKGKVRFDEKIGSGTNYGSGEDNKFMKDCYKQKLKIYYYPVNIATLNNGE
ncbi:MAG: glycosyltransferase family 2 protein, partial [Clostridia bacterium]|nr:glycosyltransferase family 2 protein [Clostridia bacterium]